MHARTHRTHAPHARTAHTHAQHGRTHAHCTSCTRIIKLIMINYVIFRWEPFYERSYSDTNCLIIMLFSLTRLTWHQSVRMTSFVLVPLPNNVPRAASDVVTEASWRHTTVDVPHAAPRRHSVVLSSPSPRFDDTRLKWLPSAAAAVRRFVSRDVIGRPRPLDKLPPLKWRRQNTDLRRTSGFSFDYQLIYDLIHIWSDESRINIAKHDFNVTVEW